MRRNNKIIAGAAVAITATAAVGTLALPAQASSDLDDCPYPYVCLYKWDDTGWQRTGQFRQITSYWQYLTVSRGAQAVVNTRHDDVVYVIHLDGTVGCFPPRNPRGGEIAPVIAIRISSSDTCR